MVVALEDREFRGTGLDSSVFLIKNTDSVMKIYARLMHDIGLDSSLQDCLGIVQLYASDTLKAKKIVESEWRNNFPEFLRKTTFCKESYDISMTILAQGDAHIRKEYGPSVEVSKKLVSPEDFVVSIGQKFISSPNLRTYLEAVYAPFFSYDSLNERDKGLLDTLSFLEEFINYKIEVPFRIVPENVKFVFVESAKKLDLIITDLARSIIHDYAILV